MNVFTQVPVTATSVHELSAILSLLQSLPVCPKAKTTFFSLKTKTNICKIFLTLSNRTASLWVTWCLQAFCCQAPADSFPSLKGRCCLIWCSWGNWTNGSRVSLTSQVRRWEWMYFALAEVQREKNATSRRCNSKIAAVLLFTALHKQQESL